MRGAPAQAGEHRRHQVDAERGQEQLLAPHPVGQVAEEQRADRRADDVERPADRDLVLADPERVLLREPRGDRADDRHLEPVEDPDGSEPDDHQPVPVAPGQAIHARGNAGFDAVLGHESDSCPIVDARNEARPSSGHEASRRVDRAARRLRRLQTGGDAPCDRHTRSETHRRESLQGHRRRDLLDARRPARSQRQGQGHARAEGRRRGRSPASPCS